MSELGIIPYDDGYMLSTLICFIAAPYAAGTADDHEMRLAQIEKMMMITFMRIWYSRRVN